MALSAMSLTPLIARSPELVADALEAIYADQPRQIRLEALQSMAEASGGVIGVSGLLLGALNEHDTTDRFIAYLRARAVDLLPPGAEGPSDADFAEDYGTERIGRPARDDFDLERLAEFAVRAQAFRCRIRVGGRVMGSGALVSPRLVLTAAHVVEALLTAAPGNGAPPKLEIIAADGQRYPARVAWHLPFHEVEPAGELPPPEAADTHADATLLRLDRPLGRLFGRMALPEQPPHWTGPGLFALIHFPGGDARGLATGRIRRDGPGDIRQFHTVNTEPGSSGGPGFDRELTFLGLHQGRWQAFRRIVPYARFARHPGFQAELAADRPPRHPWSLDGSLDTPLIIGRGAFFDALVAITEGSAPHLRGIWVRREDIASSTGLGFGYRLLKAFYAAQDKALDVLRLSTGSETDDLIGHLQAQHLGRAPAPDAGADASDRARRLAAKLQARAQASGRPLWLYFENPPSGLTQDSQHQLTALLREIMRHDSLRVIIAGFDTYALPLGDFDTPDAARHALAPGLMVEFLRDFRRSDLAATVQAMSADLGLDWGPEVQAHVIDRALRDLPTLAHQTYAAAHLAQVGDALRAAARAEVPAL